jgi:phosphate transport system substrate-binding protein
MTLKRLSPRLAVAAVAALAVAVPAASASARTTITMSGSTSVAPLTAKLAKTYVKTHKVAFKLLQGGSDIGISDVAHGRVTIGNSSRDPKSSDPAGLVFNKIAKDAVCLITNPSNRLSNLSAAQVTAIYSGQVRDWGQVPGASATGTIDIVGRTAASGTYDAFNKIFMGGVKLSTTMAQKASNGLVQQAVKSDHNAIGYVSLAFTAGTNATSYNGVACNLRNAKSGQYGGVRNFFMVTRGPARGAARSWIHWVQKSPIAKRIVSTDWVPLS